jgi:hypothetical protein
MKNFVIIILSLIVIALIGFNIMENREEMSGNNQVATSTDQAQVPPAALTIAQVTDSAITLSSGTIISINDFADEVTVAEDTKFGSSDKIKAANLSPDKKRLSIAVAGAAHDFGWIYEVDTKNLFPVVFQYGGEVDLGGWKNSTEVAFVVTTPEPKTIEKIIDLNNLDEYPKVE